MVCECETALCQYSLTLSTFAGIYGTLLFARLLIYPGLQAPKTDSAGLQKASPVEATSINGTSIEVGIISNRGVIQFLF